MNWDKLDVSWDDKTLSWSLNVSEEWFGVNASEKSTITNIYPRKWAEYSRKSCWLRLHSYSDKFLCVYNWTHTLTQIDLNLKMSLIFFTIYQPSTLLLHQRNSHDVQGRRKKIIKREQKKSWHFKVVVVIDGIAIDKFSQSKWRRCKKFTLSGAHYSSRYPANRCW